MLAAQASLAGMHARQAELQSVEAERAELQDRITELEALAAEVRVSMVLFS